MKNKCSILALISGLLFSVSCREADYLDLESNGLPTKDEISSTKIIDETILIDTNGFAKNNETIATPTELNVPKPKDPPIKDRHDW